MIGDRSISSEVSWEIADGASVSAIKKSQMTNPNDPNPKSQTIGVLSCLRFGYCNLVLVICYLLFIRVGYYRLIGS